MEIAFHFQKKTTLKNRKVLKQFLQSIFNKEKTAADSLSVIFCDDPYLLEINKSFLNHDYFTDIITFNFSPNNDVPVTGEIYISIDTVSDNALRFSVTKERELHRVIFHGVLHLCGYGDKSAKDQNKMTEMEDFYLKKYFNK